MNTYQAADNRFRQVDLPIGDCIQRGWDIGTANLGPILGYTCIVIGIHLGLAFIPILGWIAGWLINPALSAGYFIFIRKRIRGEAAVFQDFFGGFDYMGSLFLVGLVSGILISLGTLLCILPGIYLAVGYMFASFLVVSRGLDFWQAMETSRKAVTENFWSLLVFILALIGINVLGALLCLVGLIVTLPLTYCASVVAFQILFEEEIPVPPAPPSPGPIRI